ncbi:reverse transcriptase domain-containing protein [Tanacetum coccineum]
MDDEPMWADNRVVAPTPGSAITIPKTANEFAIKDTENEVVRLMMFPLSLTGEAKTWLDKLNEGTIETRDELRIAFISRFFPPALFDRLLGEIRAFSQHENKTLNEAWLRMKEMLRNYHGHNLSKGNIIKIFYHGLNEITQEVLNSVTGGIFLYKTPNQAYQLLEDKVLLKLDWAKNQKTISSLKKIVAFADEGSSHSDTDKIMVRMDAMTMKMDAQYKKCNPAQITQYPNVTKMTNLYSSSEPCQPPQAQNEHVNIVFTRSGKSYDPPINPNNQQNNSETPINFDSEDEEEKSTPQPKSQNPKPVKETPIPKPYKPKIPYPQRLRKKKMEAQYGKFLNMILVVQINVPLIDILAGMRNYGKFIKELVSNKHKLEQISSAFLSNESSAMIQNKVPPKLGDPRSFLIPCTFNKAFSCNDLADLGASINLMPYSLYAKLSLKTLKPTKMSVRLAGRSFQYPIGIAENMLVEVGKFTFLVDFVIREMEEDDEILEADFDSLLNEGNEILHSIEGTILEEKLFAEFNEFMAMNIEENFDSKYDTEEPPFKKITFNTDYKIKTSLEEPPLDLKWKPLPNHLEYVFLEEPYFLPVIISFQLFKQNKSKLISVLKRYKQDFAWKTTDISRICPSFCKHKIQLLEDKKPVV